MSKMLLRRAALIALGVAAAATAAGCAGREIPCPQVVKLADAERLTRFVGTGRDLTDVVFEARVGEITGSCAVENDTIGMLMQVQFLAMRGPAERTQQGDFGYFVAIVDAEGDVLAREGFDSRFEFQDSKSRTGLVEELEQRIPADSGTPPFTIYVGFQLNEDELAFNRGAR